MSYRIEPAKPLTGEVTRIARIQYARAIEVLRDQPAGRDEAIHDARKRFKKLRGLFRLIRSAAPGFCARENARVRDIAATLSSVRDATALVEALERLIESEATAENHDALFSVRARLVERRDRMAAEEAGLEEAIATAIAACEAGMAALADLSLPDKPGKAGRALARGLAQTYGRALTAFATAAETGAAADWHELRKRIKYHRMHVELMRKAWPGQMGLRAEVADLAGEALGDDHDLANLDALIAEDPGALGSAAEITTLRTCMAARSAALHAQVRAILKNLLMDDRKLVQSRIATLWRDAAR